MNTLKNNAWWISMLLLGLIFVGINWNTVQSKVSGSSSSTDGDAVKPA